MTRFQHDAVEFDVLAEVNLHPLGVVPLGRELGVVAELRRLEGRCRFGRFAELLLQFRKLRTREFASVRFQRRDPRGRGLLLRVQFRALRGDFRVRVVGSVGAIEGREHRLKTVVILLRDRVELVVVALRAMDRQPHERADGVRDKVVAVEVASDFTVDFRFGYLDVSDEVPRTGRKEPECFDSVHRARVQHVARDLFGDEPAVGLVRVQRADDVIAVGPRIRARLVLVVAVRFAKVDHVEPVPRPALAVLRRREQLINERLESLRVLVTNERFDFLWCGRQPDQVEVQPTDQRAPVRFW